jgi:hypothetical protein
METAEQLIAQASAHEAKKAKLDDALASFRFVQSARNGKKSQLAMLEQRLAEFESAFKLLVKAEKAIREIPEIVLQRLNSRISSENSARDLAYNRKLNGPEVLATLSAMVLSVKLQQDRTSEDAATMRSELQEAEASLTSQAALVESLQA